MKISTERFYNIFSWWLDIWLFLYVTNLTTINPFIAIILTVIWDLYGIVLLSTTSTKTLKEDNLVVHYFRFLCVLISHWIPFFTLPLSVSVHSVLLFIVLSIAYIISLWYQGLSLQNVYNITKFQSTQFNTIQKLLETRFGNIVFGTIGYVLLLYLGYRLLVNPLKNSILYQLLSILS